MPNCSMNHQSASQSNVHKTFSDVNSFKKTWEKSWNPGAYNLKLLNIYTETHGYHTVRYNIILYKVLLSINIYK